MVLILLYYILQAVRDETKDAEDEETEQGTCVSSFFYEYLFF
jgi:hypothetical protein